MDLDEIVRVSTTNEEDTKKMALELANDTGRNILEEIYNTDTITASEISEKLQIPLSTVLFHIERLTELNLIKIAETKMSKKFREMKCYAPAKRAILIIPAQKEETMSQIKNAVSTKIVAPLSLVIALGITTVIGWITQREAALPRMYEAAEKAPAPARVASEAASGTNTLHTFLLGGVVLFVVFLCIYIAITLIQKKTSPST